MRKFIIGDRVFDTLRPEWGVGIVKYDTEMSEDYFWRHGSRFTIHVKFDRNSSLIPYTDDGRYFLKKRPHLIYASKFYLIKHRAKLVLSKIRPYFTPLKVTVFIYLSVISLLLWNTIELRLERKSRDRQTEALKALKLTSDKLIELYPKAGGAK